VGVLALGALEPGRTLGDVVGIVGGAVSGDWRYVASLGDHELVGAQLVNNPAFRPNPLRLPKRDGMQFAVAAALDTPLSPIISDWEPDPLDKILARLDAIEERLADLVIGRHDDVTVDEDEWDDDVYVAAYGCPFCGDAGCRACAAKRAGRDHGFVLGADVVPMT
jgi:hypothetical protein